MARITRAALALGAGLVALAGSLTTVQAQGVGSAPVAAAGETVVMLEAGDSDRCLAAGKKNGSRAGMDFCTTDWDTGLWRVIPVDNSSFEFRAVPTDKCLEVENSGTQAGAAVQVWDCTGGKQMRWQMDLVDPARQLYQLRPTHTEGRCLDIVNGNVELGARAQSWSCNQTNAQLWRIRPVERPAS